MHLYIIPSGINVGAAHVCDEPVWVSLNRKLFLLHDAQLARLFLTFAEAHHTCCTTEAKLTLSHKLHGIKQNYCLLIIICVRFHQLNKFMTTYYPYSVYLLPNMS